MFPLEVLSALKHADNYIWVSGPESLQTRVKVEHQAVRTGITENKPELLQLLKTGTRPAIVLYHRLCRGADLLTAMEDGRKTNSTQYHQTLRVYIAMVCAYELLCESEHQEKAA